MLDWGTAVKAGMVALWAVGSPLADDPPSLSLMAQWGLAGVVVAFVLWRDYHREQAMRADAAKQDQWVRDTLIKALKANTRALRSLAGPRGDVDDETPEEK